MVLIVQTDVVGKQVERPVIGEGFWNGYEVAGFMRAFGLRVEDIVLGDEVACTRMQ